MATLVDIAREAGVSVATASIVLNAPARAGRFSQATCDRVQAIAGRVGYQRNGTRKGVSLPARSPNLAAVAREAGVSIATASMILNTPEKAMHFRPKRVKAVQEVAARLGYQRNVHASRFRTRKAQAIGLVLEFLTGKQVVDLPFWAWSLSGVDYTARSRGYEVVIVGPHENQTAVEHALAQYQQHRLDGMVFFQRPRTESTRLLANYSGPAVVMARPGRSDHDAVFEDDEAGLCAVVAHLYDLGHRRLAWLSPERWPGDAAAYRRGVVLREAQRLGVSCAEAPIREVQRIKSVEDLVKSAKQSAAMLLAHRSRPTAVICFNDDCALGLYQAAYEQGLSIPGDVSVTGYDDHHGMYFQPGLTTVRSSIVEVGQAAAAWLIDCIDGIVERSPTHPLRRTIIPRLTVRGSTAPAK